MRFGIPRERRATPEAIEQIYRRRFQAFLKVAASVAGERHAADAVHDAFVRALRHRRSFRGESPLEVWLWRLVLNAAHDLRKCDREQPLDGEDGLDDFALVHEEHEDELVRSAIAMLPPQQRTAVWLRYFVDLDYETIAQVLSVKAGTVAATLHSARAAIRRQLEEARCRI